MECTWPERPGRLNLAKPLPPDLSVQVFEPLVLRLEVFAPPNVTATWSFLGTTVIENANTHTRREAESDRPCWHAFSVQIERVSYAHSGDWTVVLHYIYHRETAGTVHVNVQSKARAHLMQDVYTSVFFSQLHK